MGFFVIKSLEVKVFIVGFIMVLFISVVRFFDFIGRRYDVDCTLEFLGGCVNIEVWVLF